MQIKKQVDALGKAQASTCFLIFSPHPFTGEGPGVGVKESRHYIGAVMNASYIIVDEFFKGCYHQGLEWERTLKLALQISGNA
jgi:hypothetical protein